MCCLLRLTRVICENLHSLWFAEIFKIVFTQNFWRQSRICETDVWMNARVQWVGSWAALIVELVLSNNWPHNDRLSSLLLSVLRLLWVALLDTSPGVKKYQSISQIYYSSFLLILTIGQLLTSGILNLTCFFRALSFHFMMMVSGRHLKPGPLAFVHPQG